MRKTKTIITAAVAAITLAGGLAAATESAAQGRGYYSRDWGRRHDNTGAAVAAGIAGLALGSMLSSGSRSYGYYGGGYGGYGGYGGGYAPSYGYGYGYAQPYYGDRYYGNRGYYGRTCLYWRHDRWGRAFQVEGRC